ncbi:Hsp20/alpha crystallin family protein [Akkermansiaceae bacterium]|nr:Hsp20/alpha crystallin family protein [Akkermansiaceae bacterium]
MQTEETPIHVVAPRSKYNKTESAIEVKILLPGVNKEDIQLNVEEGFIEVTANRTSSAKQEWNLISNKKEAEQYQLKFPVQADYDANAANAKFIDNVLHFSLPAREKKKIQLPIE